MTLEERFWSKVEKGPGCWAWKGSTMRHRGGYGTFYVGPGHVGADGVPTKTLLAQAHRVAYELARGPIPAGLELDHLCENRNCVNPAHLTPVTPTENARRVLHRRGRMHAKGARRRGPFRIVTDLSFDQVIDAVLKVRPAGRERPPVVQ